MVGSLPPYVGTAGFIAVTTGVHPTGTTGHLSIPHGTTTDDVVLASHGRRLCGTTADDAVLDSHDSGKMASGGHLVPTTPSERLTFRLS